MKFVNVFLYLGSLTFSQGQMLTLSPEAAANLALDKNPDLQQLDLDIEVQSSRITESKAASFPTVDGFANYVLLSEKQKLSIDLPPPINTTLERELGDRDKWEAGAEANWALFTGFSVRNDIAAQNYALQARKSIRDAQSNAVVFKTLLLAQATALAQVAVQARLAAVTAAESQATVTDSRQKQGQETLRSVLAAQAKVAQEQNDFVAAQIRADSLILELIQWIGLSDANLTVQMPTTPLPETWPGDVDIAIQVSARPESLAVIQQKNQLAAQSSGLNSQYYPKVSAQGSWRFANPGLNLAGTEIMNYGQIGFGLRWNFFDGRRTHSRKAQLNALSRRLEIEWQKQNLERQKSLAQSTLEWKRGKALQSMARSLLIAAEKAKSDVNVAVNTGTATQQEKLEAEAQFQRALFMKHQAEFQQRQALLRWRFARGERLDLEIKALATAMTPDKLNTAQKNSGE